MTAVCYICHKPFEDKDEAIGVCAFYWHAIPSTVTYSITEPHKVFLDTLHHKECPEDDD